MDRLVHTTLTALRAAMARQTATANNLANVSTAGFRGEIAEARASWLNGGGAPRGFAVGEVLAANLAAGSANQTGRPLDIALTGQTMLAVQSPEGAEAYTRRGDLQVAASGLLTTGDGHPVLGDGGPITVPPADSIRIAADGAVWIVPAGGDPSQPQQIDRLKLVSHAGVAVTKHLDGLFRAPADGVLAPAADARLTVGALEGSNVDATHALVEMIDAGRAWDNQIKLLTTARDLDTDTAQLMRLPS